MISARFFSVKNIAFIAGIVILLLILPKISGIVMLFFTAYVIACAMDPFVEKLQTKLKNNRTLASVITVFGGILALFALFAPIIAIAYKEIQTFIQVFPEKIMDSVNYITALQVYGHKITDLVNLNSIFNTANPDFAHNVFSQSWNITVGIFQFFIVTITIGMIIFYLLLDKEYLIKKFLELFPQNLKDRADFIFNTISHKVGGYVRAQSLSMLSIGILQMIVLVILGIDYPLLLGVITGLMDIVPVLGPTIALVIILLVACPVGIVKLILIVLTFLLIQQASNIIIRPLLFGKFMKLHPLTIFLALFVCEQFLGFLGVLLSPAIASTICILIEELYIKPINEKGESAQEANA